MTRGNPFRIPELLHIIMAEDDIKLERNVSLSADCLISFTLRRVVLLR